MDTQLSSFISLLRLRRGRASAITSGELAALLFTSDRQVRKLARDARRLGRPICGDNHGYYWAANDEEYFAELEALRSRAKDMLATCKRFRDGWKEHGSPVQERMFA